MIGFYGAAIDRYEECLLGFVLLQLALRSEVNTVCDPPSLMLRHSVLALLWFCSLYVCMLLAGKLSLGRPLD